MSDYMNESEARAVARWDVGSCLRMIHKTKQVGFEPVFERLTFFPTPPSWIDLASRVIDLGYGSLRRREWRELQVMWMSRCWLRGPQTRLQDNGGVGGQSRQPMGARSNHRQWTNSAHTRPLLLQMGNVIPPVFARTQENEFVVTSVSWSQELISLPRNVVTVGVTVATQVLVNPRRREKWRRVPVQIMLTTIASDIKHATHVITIHR